MALPTTPGAMPSRVDCVSSRLLVHRVDQLSPETWVPLMRAVKSSFSWTPMCWSARTLSRASGQPLRMYGSVLSLAHTTSRQTQTVSFRNIAISCIILFTRPPSWRQPVFGLAVVRYGDRYFSEAEALHRAIRDPRLRTLNWAPGWLAPA